MPDNAPILISQPVCAPLTPAALFLVLNIAPGEAAETAVRELCGDLSSLLRGVAFRDLQGELSCVMGFGSQAWDRLLARLAPGICIRSVRSTAFIAPSRRLATSCCTSAPRVPICASNWPCTSWIAWVTP